MVIDYKMKILPKSARETKQEDFFGKKVGHCIQHFSISVYLPAK